MAAMNKKAPPSHKENGVEVQKGPIVVDTPTSKFMTPMQKEMQDTMEAHQRRDGMTLKFHTPKQ